MGSTLRKFRIIVGLRNRTERVKITLQGKITFLETLAV